MFDWLCNESIWAPFGAAVMLMTLSTAKSKWKLWLSPVFKLCTCPVKTGKLFYWLKGEEMYGMPTCSNNFFSAEWIFQFKQVCEGTVRLNLIKLSCCLMNYIRTFIRIRTAFDNIWLENNKASDLNPWGIPGFRNKEIACFWEINHSNYLPVPFSQNYIQNNTLL